MSLKKPLEDITRRLKMESGRPNFENAVADAFVFLDFQVDVIPETQAESDLIVKAPLPQKPYFVIVECTAAREGEFVNHQKLGQIRGNAPKYFRQYGMELPTYYKVIVGRPAFSDDMKKHALDDSVMLLTTDALTKLLELHSIFQFSQDELTLIFETKGEVTDKRIDELVYPFRKNLRTCALVFMGLLEEPTSHPDRRKREWLTVQHLTGLVTGLSWFLDASDVTPTDIINAITELSSPLRRIIELSSEQGLRLTSIPFDVVLEKMGKQGVIFREIFLNFQAESKSKKSATAVERKPIALERVLERKPRKITLEVQPSNDVKAK